MSKGYAGDAPRAISAGFAVVIVLSSVATLLLIVAVFAYASGSPARIASDYTTPAAPANRALTAEIVAYASNERHDLAAAKSALESEVKTDASFDTLLGEVAFPSSAGTAAAALINADQKREKLLALQAQSRSLRKLRRFDARDRAADAAVEVQVRLIRQALGLPGSSGELF
jgi:hypothetical protein